MGKLSKKTKKTFGEYMNDNMLYMVALFFQVVVISSLLIYHIFVGIFYVMAIHIAVLASIITLSIYLKSYSHKPETKKAKRNQIVNKTQRDKVVIIPSKIKVAEAHSVSVDEADPKNEYEPAPGPVIVRPPVYEHSKKSLRRKQLVYFAFETDLINFKWCSTCKNWRSPSTLHCSRCDCCVYNFDHHCMWLSNCITKRNYKAFIVYVVIVLFGSYFSVFSVLQLFFISKDVKKVHFGILLGIISIFAVFGAIFTTILIGFHIHLRTRRITTFEYIKIKHTPEITNNTQYFSEKRIKMS